MAEHWVDIRTATREQMQAAFCIHREAIVEACEQLRRDVDSYNENTNKGAPLTVSFDFSGDDCTDAPEFGFGEALRRLKDGKRLARRGWPHPEAFRLTKGVDGVRRLGLPERAPKRRKVKQ